MTPLVLSALLLAPHSLFNDTGRPLAEVAQAYHFGAPYSVVDLADGRRQFRWEMRDALTRPSRSGVFAGPEIFAAPGTSALPATPPGKPPVCLYSVTARWQAEAWIIEAVKRPDITCT